MQTFEDFLRQEQSNRVFNGMSPNLSDEVYQDLKDKYDKMIKHQINSEPLLILCEKVLKENSEKAIEVITSHSGDASKQMGELEMYKTFLPQMMSEDEVKKLVSEFLSTSKMENMGKTIAAFKEKNAEKMSVIDMKIVSSLIKQAF